METQATILATVDSTYRPPRPCVPRRPAPPGAGINGCKV